MHTMSRRTVSTAIQAPHSWDLAHWPNDVYPHTQSRARYLLRERRDELMAAGAIVRVGRELVVIGDRFTRWLQAQATNVPGYESNANRAPLASAPG
jgi:hypothetical protein